MVILVQPKYLFNTTGVNSSVKKLAAARINAVKNQTGVEATAITKKGKLHSVTDSGVIKFNLAGNHTIIKLLRQLLLFMLLRLHWQIRMI